MKVKLTVAPTVLFLASAVYADSVFNVSSCRAFRQRRRSRRIVLWMRLRILCPTLFLTSPLSPFPTALIAIWERSFPSWQASRDSHRFCGSTLMECPSSDERECACCAVPQTTKP
jgi:hypothetical protein